MVEKPRERAAAVESSHCFDVVARSIHGVAPRGEGSEGLAVRSLLSLSLPSLLLRGVGCTAG